MADDEQEERGRPASFDRRTGEVHGAGSGAGGNNPAEDYDDDPISGGGSDPVGGPGSGSGHPLPASGEARHGEIPESAERAKGRGDDAAAIVQPDHAVNPDGEPYRYDDAGRGETIDPSRES